MKIKSIEICGFRGFRDRIAFEFPESFTVISGRNGVGKSTLFDAIEYALTGRINKYTIEKAGGESWADYVWWCGEGRADDHYVSITFLNDEGQEFEIKRSREGTQAFDEKIIDNLFVSDFSPEDALSRLCQTAIIRDELITGLSLDLSETARFDFVRSALGAIGGEEYTSRSKSIIIAAQELHQAANSRLQESRSQANEVFSQLTWTREKTSHSGDVSNALEFVRSNISLRLPDEMGEQIAAIREYRNDRQERLNEILQMAERYSAIWKEIEEIRKSKFEALLNESRKNLKSIEEEIRSLQAKIDEEQKRARKDQTASDAGSSLAALISHGEQLGLHDDRCPLCNAIRTDKDFKDGIELAKKRLKELGGQIKEREQFVESLTSKFEAAQIERLKAQNNLDQLLSRKTQLEKTHNQIIVTLSNLGIEINKNTNTTKLNQIVEGIRSEFIELDRNTRVLESSQTVNTIAEIETRYAAERKKADEAEHLVARYDRALKDAKAMDHAVKRTSAEIVDERLVAISPLLNEMYQRLRPHHDWRDIEYGIRGDVRRFLSLRVGDSLNPGFLFSSGQRRALGLAFLISVFLSRPWCRLNTLMLDDPMQHVDDFRALNLVEVLGALRKSDIQIICAVEDDALAQLICRRMPNVESQPGMHFDLERASAGKVSFKSAREIQIFMPRILNVADG